MTKPTPRKRGRPSKSAADESDNKKQALTVAALQTFGDKGYEGASLSHIAALAETDIGLIRYYFGSKQDLWQAVLTDLSTTLASELNDVMALDTTGPAEKLSAVIHWFVRMSAEHPYLSQIIAREGSDLEGRADYLARQVIKPFYSQLTTLIGAAKKAGHVTAVDNRTLFFMITHGGAFPMSLPALTNALPGGDIRTSAALKKHADAIVALIIRPAA